MNSSSTDSTPPFLPLEETNTSSAEQEDLLNGHRTSTTIKGKKKSRSSRRNESTPISPTSKSANSVKRIITLCFACLVIFLLYDAILTPPEKRFIKPDASDRFLRWVQHHPLRGIAAFLVVIAAAVVLIMPVGTPLTMGAGWVYKGAYGWKIGVFIATSVSLLGSILGACTCFLLGRYLLRDHVRTWIVKYPLFVAIDMAAAEHGLKILSMVFLTPIAPLGPLSYVSGTTSMSLAHFALAKAMSFPLMMLYVFIGASAGALVAASRDSGGGMEGAQKLEESPALILFGAILSIVMVSAISFYVKKELFKILDREKKMKPNDPINADLSTWDKDGTASSGDEFDTEKGVVELGNFSPGPNKPRHRIISQDRRDELLRKEEGMPI